jgi:hypothetical protein
MFKIKVFTENESKYSISSNFFSENRAVYEIMLKTVVEQETPQMIQRMRFACWRNKAKLVHARARTHTRTCLHARKHAHTEICNIYSFSMTKMVS